MPSAVAAIFNNPDSILLTAFALHAGYLYHRGKFFMMPQLEYFIKKYAGHDITAKKYDQISPNFIKNLYVKAINQIDQKNNKQLVLIASKLLNNFIHEQL